MQRCKNCLQMAAFSGERCVVRNGLRFILGHVWCCSDRVLSRFFSGVCHQRSIAKCLQNMPFALGNAHLIASVPFRNDILQGHADMKGTSCCNGCRAIEYCFFGDKICWHRLCSTVCHQRSIVKVLREFFYVNRKMRIWLWLTLGSAVL